jgi:hypothetical protein
MCAQRAVKRAREASILLVITAISGATTIVIRSFLMHAHPYNVQVTPG